MPNYYTSKTTTLNPFQEKCIFSASNMKAFLNLMSKTIFSTVLVLQFLPLLASSTTFKLEPFDCPQADCDSIVAVTQARNSGNVYVTTERRLKVLDEDLSEKLDRRTTSHPDEQNVLTILRGSELLSCKNYFNGTSNCALRNCSSLEVISGELTHQAGLVFPLGGGPILGWIHDSPWGDDLLTLAISSKDRGEDVDPLPLVATLTLPNGSYSAAGFLKFLTNDFNIPSSFFQSMSCLSIDVEPIYGFDTGSHNYILKVHTDKSGQKKELKLIRICKGSINFWSYMELPIECKQSEAAVDIGRIVSSTAYFTNDVLYVSVTKNIGEGAESHICNFTISTINEAFTERRRECLEGKTDSTELKWYQNQYCPQNATSGQFNFSRLNDPEYCYEEPYAQPLGGTKPIIGVGMEQLTIHTTVTAMLVVESYDTGDYIEYFLGDREGNVHRISNAGREIKVVDEGHGILQGRSRGLLLSPSGDHVYASSNRKIMQLTVKESWITAQPPTTRDATKDDGGEDENFQYRLLIYFVGAVIIVLACISCITYKARDAGSPPV